MSYIKNAIMWMFFGAMIMVAIGVSGKWWLLMFSIIPAVLDYRTNYEKGKGDGADNDELPMKVDIGFVLGVIESRKPKGLFYCKEGNRFTGVDNESGDAWTETFDTEDECIKWLISGR